MQPFDPIILSLILITPLAGAVLLAVLPDRGRLQQTAALIVTLITFGLTLHLPAHWHALAAGQFAFDQNLPWIASPAIRYHLGVDGLSMWLVVLSGLLAPLGVLASWNAIGSRKKLFYTLFLLQQVAMFGVFVSLDLFLYYAFWELALVPMTILIATFGRTEKRKRSAMKYFLYAFIPSAILLVGILWLYTVTGTMDVPTLIHRYARGFLQHRQGIIRGRFKRILYIVNDFIQLPFHHTLLNHNGHLLQFRYFIFYRYGVQLQLVLIQIGRAHV